MRYFVLLLCLCRVLSSCADMAPSAQEILASEILSVGVLPVGERYHFVMGRNDNNPLSDELLLDLYGEDAKDVFSLVKSYALYLSSGEPCEIAVLQCYARSDVDRVARMCLSRADRLRTVLMHTSYYERAEKIEISIRGSVVVMRMVA